MKFTKLLLTSALILPAISYADKNALTCATEECQLGHSSHDHDVVIPTGIMGGHMHKAGEWMFSYRYMSMDMEGLREGTDTISAQDALAQGYTAAPIEMHMEMHMFGAMYAPTDDITLMAMVNYVSKEMTMVNAMGMNPEMSSEGFGDLSVGALFRLVESENTNVHAGLSVVAPTGSTDETGQMMAGVITLPYGMQLGAGTWGIKPSITYLGQNNKLSYGAQATGTIYLGRNDNDYRLGDSIEANLWGAYKFTDNFSTTLRLNARAWGSINGTHNEILNPMMSTLTDTNNSGGQKIDAFIGAAYKFNAITLSAEIGQTLWQDLNGVQLEHDWSLNLGAYVAF